jgi:hypothetical protein
VTFRLSLALVLVRAFVGKGMTYPASIANLFVALLFFATIRGIRDHRRRGGRPYPPGPRPLPIIGNLLDIPSNFSWLTYTRFAKIYGTNLPLAESSFLIGSVGDILSFQVFGQVIVVLNTVNTAKDLLEKRAAIYSDRSPIPVHAMYVIEINV